MIFEVDPVAGEPRRPLSCIKRIRLMDRNLGWAITSTGLLRKPGAEMRMGCTRSAAQELGRGFMMENAKTGFARLQSEVVLGSPANLSNIIILIFDMCQYDRGFQHARLRAQRAEPNRFGFPAGIEQV